MSQERNNLLIAASGTGGHIFPALAIAKQVDNSWNVHWLGIKQRMDSEFVPRKYSLLTLNLNTPKNNFLIPFQYLKILFSTFTVIKIIKEKKINLVFTTGGYISAPSILAAKILNIPVIIHESNLIPGMVTKYFGCFCNFVLTGFSETKLYLKNCKIIFTGTPLRQEFYNENPLPKWVPQGQGPLLVVMGGSQGAIGINEIFYESIGYFLKNNFRIVHIIGDCNDPFNFKVTKYKNYVQKKFTKEIAALMQNCDLVISRSGAGTINELIQTGKPSILIPFPNSKNNHQEKNAMILSSKGGSILIEQNKISREFLEETLDRIFNSKKGQNKYKILDSMSENMKKYNSVQPNIQIKNLINYFLKEF